MTVIASSEITLEVTHRLGRSSGGKLGGGVGKSLWIVGVSPDGKEASPGASQGFPQARTQVIPRLCGYFTDSAKPKSDFYPESTGLIMITITFIYIYILKKRREGVDR